MRPYSPKEVLLLHYPYTGHPDVLVGRTPNAEEADALNQGEIPWEGVSKVARPKGKVHFFSECRGHKPRRIAYAVQDTTCLHCLNNRATRLKGFRWTHEHNAEEVAFLKSKLGSKVDGFDAEQPGDDHLRETIKWLEQ